ncbi:predicted protein [Micromonas commoda]|uniref:Uncharacterized protein n=1 Tax=Micromonas commoda (strain RCC299 / NOUM17 / CCMP2709) TaxID=296587 RepID=C1EJL0_MICCC|nr:predicted protein [Micromonas commoda]ACO68248.1 predicted protein [Micromonas commoda]|eukprot:XP_002506990.1 predicted protein [Micromonas commoda]
MADATRHTHIAPRGGRHACTPVVDDPSPGLVPRLAPPNLSDLIGARPKRRAVRPPTTRAHTVLPLQGHPDARDTPSFPPAVPDAHRVAVSLRYDVAREVLLRPHR